MPALTTRPVQGAISRGKNRTQAATPVEEGRHRPAQVGPGRDPMPHKVRAMLASPSSSPVSSLA